MNRKTILLLTVCASVLVALLLTVRGGFGAWNDWAYLTYSSLWKNTNGLFVRVTDGTDTTTVYQNYIKTNKIWSDTLSSDLALIDTLKAENDPQISVITNLAPLPGATYDLGSVTADWDSLFVDDVDVDVNLTAGGTIQGEHLVSTDDADINDNLTVGDLVVDEASGVINFSGANMAVISTTTEDLKLDPAGSDVSIDGGLTVGSDTDAGDNNLRVEGTSALVGDVTITADLTVNGGQIEIPTGVTQIGTGATDTVSFVGPVNVNANIYPISGGDITLDVDASGEEVRLGDTGTAGEYISVSQLGVLTTQDILPDSDNDKNLGTAEYRYADLFANQISLGDSTTGDYDAIIYFADDASIQVESLKWDDGNDRFEFTDDLYASGSLTLGGGLTITGDIVPSSGATYDLGSATADWDSLFVDDVDVDANLTVGGIVQGEQLTSTDDADVNDNLTVGDIVIDEATGVLSFTGATSATISTGTANLTLSSAAGTDVLIGDGSTLLYVDGGTNTVGVRQPAVANAAFTTGWNADTMPAGATYARHLYTQGNITELVNGTISDIVGAYFNTFTVTDGGGTETVGILATAYIPGAPTQGSAPTNGPYSLFVDAGESRFDGDIGDATNRVPVLYGVDIDASDDILLADGAVVGITGNEIITFNSAGTVVVSGAILQVDVIQDNGNDATLSFSGTNGVDIVNALTAGTISSDATVVATTSVQVGTVLNPDIDQGADIGATATKFNHVYGDSAHFNHYGGNSDFTLGASGEDITVSADTLKGTPVGLGKRWITAKNTGATLTTADFGKTITVNSGSTQTINLPSVDATNIGGWFTIVKLGAGQVTIDAPDSDLIADSSAGGTIYNNVAAETYAVITLQLVSATQWVIVSAHGTWTTT